MRKRVIFAALMFLAAPLFSGCSDDETTGPEGGEEYLVLGHIMCRPYVDFSAVVHDVYRKGCDIDSILVCDSLCSEYESYNLVPGEGSETSYYYNNRADSTRLRSGDVATVRFYDGINAALTEVAVLSWNNDSVKYISPLANTVINPSESFELVWHRVANAHWYGLNIHFVTDSAGTMVFSEWYAWTEDTTLVIDGSGFPKNGQISIAGVSVAGPSPGSAPNVSGLKLTGTIYGLANPAAVYFTVGTGFNPGVVGKISPWQDEPDSLAIELIEKLYEAGQVRKEAI
ncbi:MAG: hypothetical protein AB1483_01275 [Candidatus Zixiibacteriota bacterium]